MKKVISILLAITLVIMSFAVVASAADAKEVTITNDGYTVEGDVQCLYLDDAGNLATDNATKLVIKGRGDLVINGEYYAANNGKTTAEFQLPLKGVETQMVETQEIGGVQLSFFRRIWNNITSFIRSLFQPMVTVIGRIF